MSDSCDPMDCSLMGTSVHGILQAGILEWAAISFSRGSSRPRDQTQISCIAWGFFTNLLQGKISFRLTELMSLLSKRLSRVFSKTTVPKHQFFGTQLFLWPNAHIHTWLLEKPYVRLYGPLLVSRFAIAFLPRSKRLLISWLQSPTAVIFSQEK